MLSNGLFLLLLILVDVSISNSLELVEHGDLVWDLESATRGEDSLAPASKAVRCVSKCRGRACVQTCMNAWHSFTSTTSPSFGIPVVVREVKEPSGPAFVEIARFHQLLIKPRA